jgi:carbamoyltransferase
LIILGISAFYHDSAACLIVDGEILCAAQEERFTRIRHDGSFPLNSIKFCLNSKNLTINQVDYIVFYEKPNLKLRRIFSTYLHYLPKGIGSFAKVLKSWFGEKLWTNLIIRQKLRYFGKIRYSEHHLSHAAAAFYPSPYKEAAFLTIDGVGEWLTTSYGFGQNEKITISAELNYPHSLGLLYSAFTYYLGFKVDSAEYKVMGLAPYGQPKYVDLILKNLIDLKHDGSFHLNMTFFDFCVGQTMTNKKFDELFGGPRRSPESHLDQRIMDIARSLQEVTELVVMKIAAHVYDKTKLPNLCLAGGVALNCVSNGKLLKDGPFDNIWIQPAAGDAGSAIGAALYFYHKILGFDRVYLSGTDQMKGSLLGPEYSEEYVEDFLNKTNIPFKKMQQDKLNGEVVDLLAKGNVIGWFQGRMEFGPRSLGNRSIIGDPRNKTMQKKMNLKIKQRESFRPFAPAVLFEKVKEYFDLNCESPYMLFVTNVNKDQRYEMTSKEKKLFGLDKLNLKKSSIPAVTHVDYSARIQTVDSTRNPRFYSLLQKNFERYNCPILINTSFNVRGEPIVCSPEDAFNCFMSTGMDYLVIESYLISKKDQSNKTIRKISYELD